MTKLEKIAELRSRAEEALRRSFSGPNMDAESKPTILEDQLSISQIETILENEELRLTKKQLQTELRKFKDLYNYAPLVYLTVDREGKIIQFNQAAYRFISHQGFESGRLTIYEIADDQSGSELYQLINKAYRTGNDQSGIVGFKNAQMELTHYQVIISKVQTSGTNDPLLQLILTNTSKETKYIKTELKEKESAYEELLSNISEGIFYADNGILTSVNSSLGHILGYDKQELTGRNLLELVTDCYQEKVGKLIKLDENSTLKPSYDVKFVRQDGTVFWGELKLKHLPQNGKSFGTIDDITQRKLVENRLRDSERSLRKSNAAKDKFFSIIAHDLKSPFSTLMGYNYLLMKEYHQYDDQKRESMIRSLYDITKQTFNLLENMLVWSRSQTGGMPFAPRAINITKLVIENIRLYTPTARAKNITLTTETGLKDKYVFADPGMIQTVLRNLVTNAIKFTPEKGSVTLNIHEEDTESLIVSVLDTGVGIDPAKKDQLFQVDSNYSTLGTHDEKGTGLGLVICKEFIEKNGGKIWIESKQGKGSRFSFSLLQKVWEEF